MYIAVKSDEAHPAYLCGRLAALLDEIHREARGVAEDHYGPIQKIPRQVLGQYLDIALCNLSKIPPRRRDRYHAQLVDIWYKLPSLPETFIANEEDRTLFSRGYCWQLVQRL